MEFGWPQWQNNRGGLTVWGAISANGKLSLEIMDGYSNAAQYIDMLEGAHIDKEGRRLQSESFIFQHDNAPIPKTKATLDFFHATGVEIMLWPARNSDLNPTENAWGYLTSVVYRGGSTCSLDQD
ncbi:Hypothetical predicted protein [Octopus vulgaris]|uniref:Tc1-like transposase DDE domain-containing protein n=1 Tax=Octopus vulgaris TaxID=6645 RepID=A0AA36BQB5_OCTVU|nr:Hypothetical predicted protein [Octopus vulgaris]